MLLSTCQLSGWIFTNTSAQVPKGQGVPGAVQYLRPLMRRSERLSDDWCDENPHVFAGFGDLYTMDCWISWVVLRQDLFLQTVGNKFANILWIWCAWNCKWSNVTLIWTAFIIVVDPCASSKLMPPKEVVSSKNTRSTTRSYRQKPTSNPKHSRTI